MPGRVIGSITGSAVPIVVMGVRAGSVLLRVDYVLRRGAEGVLRRRSCPEDELLVAVAWGGHKDSIR
jgi:uncharacterized membrane protein